MGSVFTVDQPIMKLCSFFLYAITHSTLCINSRVKKGHFCKPLPVTRVDLDFQILKVNILPSEFASGYVSTHAILQYKFFNDSGRMIK